MLDSNAESVSNSLDVNSIFVSINKAVASTEDVIILIKMSSDISIYDVVCYVLSNILNHFFS